MAGVHWNSVLSVTRVFQLPLAARQCFHLSRSASANLSFSNRRAFAISSGLRAKRPRGTFVKPGPDRPTSGKTRQGVSHRMSQQPPTPDSPSEAEVEVANNYAEWTTTDGGNPANKPNNVAISPVTQQSRSQGIGAYQADPFIHKLATSSTPTLLYELSSPRRFIAVTYTTSIYFSLMGYWTLQNFAMYTGEPNLAITATAYLVPALWCGLGAYCAFAPYKMIAKITALPASAGTQATKTSLRPRLQFEPLVLLPFVKATPCEVPIQDVVSRRRFAGPIGSYARGRAAEKVRGGPLSGIFKMAGGLVRDIAKMLTRAPMVHVRMLNNQRGWKGNWKVDCQACEALEGGKALDQLIKVDDMPVDWQSRLVKQTK